MKIIIGIISSFIIALTSNSVLATPFSFFYEGTLGYTNVPGLTANSAEVVKITVNLDNGASSNLSQTWDSSHLLSISFDFNNGTLLTTFNDPFSSGTNASGNFETNATGSLIEVPSFWAPSTYLNDGSNDALVDTNADPDKTLFQWAIGNTPSVYVQNVANQSDYEQAQTSGTQSGVSSSWSASPVSAVPVPAAVWLMGSALAGLLGFRRRKS